MGAYSSKTVKRIFVNNIKIVAFAILIAVSVAAAWYIFSSQNTETQDINDFEACAEAGYPIAESYPRQCRIPDGRMFVEAVSPVPVVPEMIRVFSPEQKALVTSPLKIKGEARGTWFFEASFPIFIEDEAGREIGRGIATAQGEWMTEEFVPFTAEIVFERGNSKSGVVVFEKDNPSGLPENADSISVPVLFENTNKRKVEIFYYNRKADPDVLCRTEAVQAVSREIDVTKSPIRDTLELLISGRISRDEEDAGIMTDFPIEGLSLKGVNLKEGILFVEFSDPQNKTGGGSCKVSLLRAQIEKTALQFREVREVRILPEEAFQP